MDSQDTVSNTVTATLTWQGDGPAPPVIVEEDADASWYIDGDGTGTCDCGLPNATHIQYTQDAYDFATRYTIYAPSASGTITLPAVTTSGSTTLADGLETDNFVNLSYSVTPIPFTVTITLDGTTPDSNGDLNILIGQGCTGTITAGPLSLSNFQWDAGGTVFDQFLTASDKAWGHATPVSSDQWHQPHPHWHYLQSSTFTIATVTCSATASINGVAIGTVQGQQKVTVWTPSYFFNYNAGPSTIVGDEVRAGGTNMDLQPGMHFFGAVGTQSMFRATPTGPGTGQWAFWQLCNINEAEHYLVAAPNVNSTNGFELDNDLPVGGPYNADSTDNVRTQHDDTDSPGLGILNLTNHIVIHDKFQTYLMYLPPGNDPQWVPLDRLEWFWDVDITPAGTGWTPSPPGSVTTNPDQRWAIHPTWTEKYTNPSGQ